MKVYLLFTFVIFAIINVCTAKEPDFQGLDDLPGGYFYSFAYDASANGIVVGMSESASGDEGFTWENRSISGLDNMDGGLFGSNALGVSADGDGWGVAFTAPAAVVEARFSVIDVIHTAGANITVTRWF